MGQPGPLTTISLNEVATRVPGVRPYDIQTRRAYSTYRMPSSRRGGRINAEIFSTPNFLLFTVQDSRPTSGQC
jgi:hypothetical protein